MSRKFIDKVMTEAKRPIAAGSLTVIHEPEGIRVVICDRTGWVLYEVGPHELAVGSSLRIEFASGDER